MIANHNGMVDAMVSPLVVNDANLFANHNGQTYGLIVATVVNDANLFANHNLMMHLMLSL